MPSSCVAFNCSNRAKKGSEITFHRLLAVGDLSECLKNQKNTSPASEVGILGRSDSSLIVNDANGTSVCTLNTMPKRSRQSSTQSKKSRKSDITSSKRNSIPRSCKNNINQKNTKSKFDEFDDLLSMIPAYNFMGSSQSRFDDTKVELKNEKKDVTTSWSNDELDVVFDVQEEKKNKIYEVITVMSDDETPNKVSFERIYADDPEKRKVDESEVDLEILQKQSQNERTRPSTVIKDLQNDSLTASLNLTHLDLEVKPIDPPPSVYVPQPSFEEIESISPNGKASNICIEDSDSDSIVCVAVVNSKIKAGEKKSKVEEVCLSSDSEPSSYPKIPPIKLKLTSSDIYPNITSLRDNYSSGHSFRPIEKNNDFSFKSFRPQFYPYNQWNSSNPVTEFGSFSNSSSDGFQHSSSPSNSSAKAYSEESTSSTRSGFSNQQQSKTTENIRESSSSTLFSSSDEEKDDFHKAQTRSKSEVRYEEFTDFGRKVHKGETEIDTEKHLRFKVMSYNVLAQTLLEQHMYLYSGNDNRALQWVQRWNLIYNEIKDENPEILCLQEVQHSHILTHYNKLCDLGYKYIYKKRTGRYMDGVAVFFKTSLFTEERVAKVEYYQPGVPVLDRDNVGVVVRLRLKQSPADAIVIATTHLLYNPKRSDIKLAQTQMLLAEIDRVAYNTVNKTYYPVIVTGDFNLVPSSGVYKLITEGKITYEGTSRKTLVPVGQKHILTKTLLPLRLGVTDYCQHVDVLEARLRGEEVVRNKRLFHSELNVDPYQNTYEHDHTSDNRFGTGTLHQNFKFLSVYPHIQAGNQREASTYHDSWVTVDYIFYSSPKGEEEESNHDQLQLLSRLRLPVEDELNKFIGRLPNMDFGSDHLPLVCKFLMRLHYCGFNFIIEVFYVQPTVWSSGSGHKSTSLADVIDNIMVAIARSRQPLMYEISV